MNDNNLIELIVTAPGKVILFGEHSVVYGKQAIAASIDKKTQAIFKEQNNDQNICVNFPDIQLEIVINLSTIKIENKKDGKTHIEPQSINHVELNEIVKKDVENYSLDEFQKCAVLSLFYLLRGIFSNSPIKIPSFKILITSQLTIGAGTGSSASFAICLAASLFLYFKAKLYNIPKSQLSISDEDKEIINKWAYSCERLVHGTPSGLDNFVCTYGSVSVTNDPETRERKMNILENAGKLRILLVNSGKPRRTANMVKNVSELKERQKEIVESLLSIMDNVARDASNVISCIGNLQNSVASATEVTKNIKQLQDLIDINQGLLVALGVSHPDLNNIIAITSKYGLHSKLTGAGGGGYAYTLIPPDVSESSVQECVNDLVENGYETQDVKLAVQGVSLD